MKKYKYLLLDWDGCCAMTLDLWLAEYVDVLKNHYKLNLTENWIVEKLFGGHHEPLKEIYNIDIVDFYAKLKSSILPKIPKTKLYPEVKNTIKMLHQNNIKIVIISSQWKSSLEESIQYNNLDSLIFDFIGREDTKEHKPKPAPLNLAINKLKVGKENCIMVGDSDNDILAAKSANVTSALFYPKHNEKFYKPEYQKSLNADYVIKNFESALELF